MMELKDAIKIAKELKENIDRYAEYDNAFVFWSTQDEGYIGGGHSPIVIMKSNSKAIPYAQYVIDGQGKEIREGVIDE